LRIVSSVFLIEMFDLRGRELKYANNLLLNHYRKSVQYYMRLQDMWADLKLLSQTTYIRCFEVIYCKQLGSRTQYCSQERFGLNNWSQFSILSQIFCYWGKQQSADSNVIQFHLTLKCTKGQAFHFCDYFLVSKWIFQNHDHGLTKLHAGSEQLLCVVINNSSYPPVKQQHSRSCIWEILNTGKRVSKLSVKILLTQIFLLYVSTKQT